MQDWLTNDQNINPFDPAAPLDVDEIADHLQRYWHLYFKNENQTQPSNNRNRNNKRGRDNDNQKKLPQTAQTDSKKAKKDKGNIDGSVANNHTNNNRRGRDSDSGRCPIKRHVEMRHDWRGYHLNPYSQRYDPYAGQAFYENKAHDPSVWYRDVFKSASR